MNHSRPESKSVSELRKKTHSEVELDQICPFQVRQLGTMFSRKVGDNSALRSPERRANVRDIEKEMELTVIGYKWIVALNINRQVELVKVRVLEAEANNV